MAGGPNLFARLHKWASRQDENFLTESLALVIEQLLLLAPAAGVRIVRQLTGGFIDLAAEDASTLDVRTQIEARQGRPDLEFATPYRLAWVEVKAESELRVGQLEGYRVLLGECVIEETTLVLLTRYPTTFSSEDSRPDLEVRWYEVADWFEDEIPATKAAGDVAAFLTHQFLSFLRERNMTLTQVGKYMPEGVRALSSLLNMLFEAASACKVPVKKAGGWDESGLTLDGLKYWVGLNFADPEKLWFGTRCRIDPEAARRLGGEITEESWIPGRFRWWNSVGLDSESVHFFSRTKVSQMQWLESFLRDCLAKARSIEVPDQSPIPDESEGS